MQLVLAVDPRADRSRAAEFGEPGDEVRREHLGAAVEAVAGKPDQLFLREAERAGMIELGAQFLLVDDVGQPDML
jgi:hypothetical protein